MKIDNWNTLIKHTLKNLQVEKINIFTWNLENKVKNTCLKFGAYISLTKKVMIKKLLAFYLHYAQNTTPNLSQHLLCDNLALLISPKNSQAYSKTIHQVSMKFVLTSYSHNFLLSKLTDWLMPSETISWWWIKLWIWFSSLFYIISSQDIHFTNLRVTVLVLWYYLCLLCILFLSSLIK